MPSPADLKEGKSEVVCEQGKLIKLSKDKEGVITATCLTKKWTDWVDYWRWISITRAAGNLKVAKNLGVDARAARHGERCRVYDFEERWTGSYIFENEWQSFRTGKTATWNWTSVSHNLRKPGRYVIAVKVIDIFRQ